MIRFIFLFCLVGAFLVDRQSKAAELLEAQRMVLSVGIDRFQYDLWHPLRYTSKDARDMFEALRSSDPSFDGGELIVSPGGFVGKKEILRSMKRLSEANRNEDDVLVVYFSTHGTVGYKADGSIGRYIITSDADPKNLAETALDYDEVIDWFHSLRSSKKVLILAFCHSGVGKSILTPEMKRALAQLKSPYFEEPMTARSEGSIVLAASGWREPAIEDSSLENDVYTHYLIQGLRQDLNKDGAVSITEAHQYSAQKTYQHTKGRQRPSATLELLGADPIIVDGQLGDTTKASLYSLIGRFSKLLVEVDDKPMGSLEKGILVPKGRVKLTLKDPDNKQVVSQRVVRFEAGREYSVANFLVPRLANHLSLGASGFYALDENLRRSYLPNASSGLQINYRRDEWVSIYDLKLALAWYGDQNEQILVDEQTFDQTRRMGVMDIQLGLRERWFSLSSNLLRTEWKAATGLSMLYIDRELASIAFEQPSANLLSPGLKLSLGLDVVLPYHLLQFSWELEASQYRSFAEQASGTALTSSLSIGSFW